MSRHMQLLQVPTKSPGAKILGSSHVTVGMVCKFRAAWESLCELIVQNTKVHFMQQTDNLLVRK